MFAEIKTRKNIKSTHSLKKISERIPLFKDFLHPFQNDAKAKREEFLRSLNFFILFLQREQREKLQ